MPDGSPRRTGATRPLWLLARVTTEASAPAVLIALTFLAVGWHSTRSAGTGTGAGLAWGLFAVLFASLIPFAYIVGNVRRGRLTDHHVGVPEQRRTPLLISLGSVLLGLVPMYLLDAPRPLRALATTGAVGLAIWVPVSNRWKMSIHAAVAAGAAVIAVLVFGPWLFAAWPALLLVGWSRVWLGDHSIPQVTIGALVGALVAGTVFPALR